MDELQNLAKNALGAAAQVINELFLDAKMPLHLNKSINQAHLGSVTYEQIVSHLEMEIEVKGLEAPDELEVNP